MYRLLTVILFTSFFLSCRNKEVSNTFPDPETPAVETTADQENEESQGPPTYYYLEEDETDYLDQGLGENLDEFYAYVTDIYMKNNSVYVDIDLVDIRYENIDERVIVNNNPRIRTYIVDEHALIYSHECKTINHK